MMVLLKQAFRIQHRMTAIVSITAVLLVFTVIAFWPMLQRSGSLGELTKGLPPNLVIALGLDAFDTPVGYLRGNLYAVILPFIMGFLAVFVTTGATASDEEMGRFEIMLTLPISRTAAFGARLVSCLLQIVIVTLALTLSVVTFAWMFNMDVPAGSVWLAGAGLALFASFHSALTFAIGAGVGSKSVAWAVPSTLLVFGYLIQAVTPMTDQSDLAWVSPWQWLLGDQILSDSLPSGGVIALATGMVLFSGLGLFGVSRRDIRNA